MSNKTKQIKLTKYKYISIITAAFAVMIALTTLLNFQVAKASKDEVNKVYHVYASGQHLGVITDKDFVENAVNKKVEELNKQYNGVELTSSSNITYVAEIVFKNNGDINNQKVADLVVSKIKPLQQAYALKLDGQVVTYLASEAEVEATINKLKLKYVTEAQLQQIESAKLSRQALPELKDGETRVLDVTLSKDVTNEATQVAPEKVLTVDEAILLLENGSLTQDLYEVKSGDVLGSIANKHGLKLKELLAINPGLTENTVLNIGQKVNVTVYKPHLSVTVQKEMKVAEEIGFETKYVDNSSMLKGETKVETKGSKGSKLVTYSVSTQNGQEVKREVINTTVVKEPVTQVIQKGTKVIPSRGDGQFSWPTYGGYISSQMGYRWGRMHTGIDIARPSDRTIKASDNGTVESVIYSNSGKGNHVIINHNNGFKTVYAHLSSISVKRGQTVAQNQKIGVMGSTGNSTGVHLHFEVLKNGSYVNPLNYISR